MPEHTPRVPPEAVKAAVSATRSTEPWCELAISAALPFLHADWEREQRERLEGLAERIDGLREQALKQEDKFRAEVPEYPGWAAGEAGAAEAFGEAAQIIRGSIPAALTNREETPNG